MEQPTQLSMPKIIISWDQYNKDVHELAKMIKASEEEFHCIYAIPRGGYILGVHLSHLLKIPLIEKPYGNTLVVDEISDTGGTLSSFQYKKMYRAKIATLHIKEETKTVPHFWVAKYKQNCWIEYPWEV